LGFSIFFYQLKPTEVEASVSFASLLVFLAFTHKIYLNQSFFSGNENLSLLVFLAFTHKIYLNQSFFQGIKT
jgi:hypothetical protein